MIEIFRRERKEILANWGQFIVSIRQFIKYWAVTMIVGFIDGISRLKDRDTQLYERYVFESFKKEIENLSVEYL